jgi:hypothetical protein
MPDTRRIVNCHKARQLCPGGAQDQHPFEQRVKAGTTTGDLWSGNNGVTALVRDLLRVVKKVLKCLLTGRTLIPEFHFRQASHVNILLHVFSASSRTLS